MKKFITLTLTILLLTTLVFVQPNNKPSQAAETSNIQNTIVYVDNYTGSTDSDKIQKAIDFATQKGNPKTVLVSDRDYIITKPIVIKKDVKLEFAYGARLVVEGNFRVIELQKNASLKGAYIAIDTAQFDNDVIYLYGANNYYNSWWRSEIEDINIVNWTESHKGTAIKLYTNGKTHEISFLKFENIKIAEMGTAINIQSDKAPNVPYYNNGYISANQFNNIVIDNVLTGIVVNKASGNSFTNIQFQLESKIKSAINVIGSQYNKFEGMIWDGQRIPAGASPIFTTDSNSSYNEFDLRGDIFPRFYSIKGEKNQY
jgi:hypothetical protein